MIFYRNDRKIEYKTIGEGAPVLLLHGLGGGIRQIESAFDPIPGVQIIALDQQGHGGTDADWDRLDFNALADDAVALLDKLGVRRCVIGGISMGAAVSLNISLRHPERADSLMLIRNAWLDGPMSADVRTAYADLGHALRDRSSEGFMNSRGWELVRDQGNYTVNAFTGVFREELGPDQWKRYLIMPEKAPMRALEDAGGIRVPTMILANRNDFCHPFEYGRRLHEAIPSSLFYEIPDKDTDPKLHRRMSNDLLRELIALRT